MGPNEDENCSSLASYICLVVRRPSKSVLSSGKLSASAPERRCRPSLLPSRQLLKNPGARVYLENQAPQLGQMQAPQLGPRGSQRCSGVHLELSREPAIPGC